MKKFKLIYKTIYFGLIGVVVLVSFLTLMSVLGIPKNAQMFAVETGSMEPSIPTGSLVFVSPQETYSVGDVITYKSNLGKLQKKDINVTHRIVNVINDSGDTFYETKGDANTGNDPWTANGLDVLGKVNFQLPVIGYIVAFAKTKLGFIFLILVPATVIVMLEIMNIINVIKNPKSTNEEPSKRLMRSKLYFEL